MQMQEQRPHAFCELRRLLRFCSGTRPLVVLWTQALCASGGKERAASVLRKWTEALPGDKGNTRTWWFSILFQRS